MEKYAEDKYIAFMKKGIKTLKQLIRKECEDKDNGKDAPLDNKQLYLYSTSLIDKQNALIESYENTIKTYMNG